MSSSNTRSLKTETVPEYHKKPIPSKRPLISIWPPHQETAVPLTAQTALNNSKHLADHLLNKLTISDYQAGIEKGLHLLAETLATTDQPFSGIYPHELAKQFESINLAQPLTDFDSVLAEVKQLFLTDAVYFHHQKYMAHLNCPITLPSLVGELIASAVNTAVETWDQSGGATLIEQTLIHWINEKIGFLPENADGVFTSGGSQSNLMAVLLARDHACNHYFNHSVKHTGLPKEANKLRIFTSEKSHFSIQKAASILGLGSNSVVTVPCDARYCINPDTLLSLIEKNIALDNIPMAVIATAGTTDFGSIDPILPIADICERYNIWLHVDAAYGGGLLLSKKHRLLLSGIEKADSITVDFHKSFFQPVSCSTFLLQNKTHFSNITYHADYLNPFSQYEEGTPDSINKSIQTTRRFDALKLWLTLRTQGEDSIGEMFDHVISLAHEVFLLLLADRLIDVIHTPQLSALVFRFKPLGAYSPMQLNHTNHYIRKALSRSGEALIAATKVNNEQYLKFTLLNPATTLDDIQSVIKAIKQHGLTFMQHKGW